MGHHIQVTGLLQAFKIRTPDRAIDKVHENSVQPRGECEGQHRYKSEWDASRKRKNIPEIKV